MNTKFFIVAPTLLILVYSLLLFLMVDMSILILFENKQHNLIKQSNNCSVVINPLLPVRYGGYRIK